jgi:hypothetical protein
MKAPALNVAISGLGECMSWAVVLKEKDLGSAIAAPQVDRRKVTCSAIGFCLSEGKVYWGCRLLRLKLTDGKVVCTAIEFKPLPDLQESALVPGCKVLFVTAPVKDGILLLDAKSLRVSHLISQACHLIIVEPPHQSSLPPHHCWRTLGIKDRRIAQCPSRCQGKDSRVKSTHGRGRGGMWFQIKEYCEALTWQNAKGILWFSNASLCRNSNDIVRH